MNLPRGGVGSQELDPGDVGDDEFLLLGCQVQRVWCQGQWERVECVRWTLCSIIGWKNGSCSWGCSSESLGF